MQVLKPPPPARALALYVRPALHTYRLPIGLADDTRIRAALESVQYLTNNGAKVVLCSHFGRPKAGVTDEFRLDGIAGRLSELLDQDVRKTNDCIGPEVDAAVADSTSSCSL